MADLSSRDRGEGYLAVFMFTLFHPSSLRTRTSYPVSPLTILTHALPMPTTSPTRLSGPLASRSPRIEPGSYVAFKIDPHATLAVLGDAFTDICTKELLESEHNKVYLGLVLTARLIGHGHYDITLSVIGPKPATLPQDSANTFVPIFSSRVTYDYSIAHLPVFPQPPLSYEDAYHYPIVLRAKVSATVFPEDCRLFPDGFPKLKKTEVKRLKDYAKRHARRINGPGPRASQGNQVLVDLKPMDMAAQLAQVKTAIQLAPLGAFDPETSWEQRDRWWLLERERDPTRHGCVCSWEPVVTIWMDPSEAGDSLTLPEMLDPELAVLKRCGSHLLVKTSVIDEHHEDFPIYSIDVG